MVNWRAYVKRLVFGLLHLVCLVGALAFGLRGQGAVSFLCGVGAIVFYVLASRISVGSFWGKKKGPPK